MGCENNVNCHYILHFYSSSGTKFDLRTDLLFYALYRVNRMLRDYLKLYIREINTNLLRLGRLIPHNSLSLLTPRRNR